MIQDCHVKIEVGGRIVPIGENGIKIRTYLEACVKELTQSTGRIQRGDLRYKAYVFLMDFDEDLEVDITRELISYYSKFGYEINRYNMTEDARKKERKNKIFTSILKHVDDRNTIYNLGENIKKIYTFNMENLFKEEKNKSNYMKYNEAEIVSIIVEAKRKHFETTGKKLKNTEIFPDIISQYGISEPQLKRYMKNYKNLLIE